MSVAFPMDGFLIQLRGDFGVTCNWIGCQELSSAKTGDGKIHLCLGHLQEIATYQRLSLSTEPLSAIAQARQDQRKQILEELFSGRTPFGR
jgi:hypothetical protein